MIEEAAALWKRRDEALDDPALTLDDVFRLDEQLQSRLRAVEAVPDPRQPGEVFVATVVGFTPKTLEAALRTPENFRGLESGLGWMEFDSVPLEKLPARAAIAACAVHRVDPGPILEDSLRSRDPLLRARAVKAVWQLGRRDLIERLSYEDPDVPCRFSACWAGALLAGDRRAVEGLKRFAESGVRYPDRAVQLASFLMSPSEARAWHRSLPPELSVLGAAVLGTREDVQRLRAQGALEAARFATGEGGPDSWEGRHFLGRPSDPAWLRHALRFGRMPHRSWAATELAVLVGGARSNSARRRFGRSRSWPSKCFINETFGGRASCRRLMAGSGTLPIALARSECSVPSVFLSGCSLSSLREPRELRVSMSALGTPSRSRRNLPVAAFAGLQAPSRRTAPAVSSPGPDLDGAICADGPRRFVRGRPHAPREHQEDESADQKHFESRYSSDAPTAPRKLHRATRTARRRHGSSFRGVGGRPGATAA